MEARPGCNVEHASSSELLEMANKKIALTVSALIPVDKFVPFIDKTPDVFIFVLVCLAYFFGLMAVFLRLLFLLGKVSQFYDKSLVSLRSDVHLSWK